MAQDQDQQKPDARARNGSPADRSPMQAASNYSTASGAVGLLVGTADWWYKCHVAHQIVMPDNALLVMWATALAPTLILMKKIVDNKLSKAAGE